MTHEVYIGNASNQKRELSFLEKIKKQIKINRNFSGIHGVALLSTVSRSNWNLEMLVLISCIKKTKHFNKIYFNLTRQTIFIELELRL